VHFGRPEEMEKLSNTPDGREHTRQSADAWGRADLAAGTPANEAEARTTRTIQAYLGIGADK